MRWPIAAAPTRGIACTRSVPTISRDDSVGYSSINMTIINEPLPTDVMPTKNPPITPTMAVGTGRTRRWSIITSGIGPRRDCTTTFTSIAAAASRSTAPRISLMSFSTPLLATWSMTYEPANAAGTEPTASQRTSVQFTVRLRM